MRRSKTDYRTLTSMELQERIYELRKKGMNQYEIAAELGIARSTVWQHLERAYKAHAEALADERQHVVELELQRADALLGALWTAAEGGDTKAANEVRKLGGFAPVKVQTLPELTDDQIRQQLQDKLKGTT
jgi:predicted DNA-binding protein (UPF0251 family)